MPDYDAFEQRLQSALRDYAEGWVVAVDPYAFTERVCAKDRRRRALAPLAIRRLAWVVLAAALLALLLTTGAPFGGSELEPMPTFDPTTVLTVTGSQTLTGQFDITGGRGLEMRLELSDPRVSGAARIVLHEEADLESGLARWSGVMRLDDPDGWWVGTVEGTSVPTGTAALRGWLSGRDRHEGFTFFYEGPDPSSYEGPGTGASEQAVEGVIWPGDPPPAPVSLEPLP